MTPSPKKKPRLRKLERDRARAADKKETSSRHAAAKKAAKAKRVKAAKPAKATRAGQDDTAAKPAKARHRDRPASSTPDTKASRSGRTRSDDARPAAKRGGTTRAGGKAPVRAGADRPSRDDRPARASRADRAERAPRGDRPSRPARDTRTDRPARTVRSKPLVEGSRSERAASDTRTARVARPARTERPSAAVDRVPRPRRESAQAKPLPQRLRNHEPREPKATVAPETDTTSVDVSSWAELGVAAEFLPVLRRMGIATPFPIQSMTLPDALDQRDVLGRAQTGSGKTLAFGLAMLSRLAHRTARANHPLGLVLVPTRELAMQVTDALVPFAQSVGLDIRLIAGGMPYTKQIDALRRGVPVLVATPGRLNDLVAQGHVKLGDIEVTVLDEADQMCDMGFAPQITEVLDLTPDTGQRLLFSATLDGDVDAIVRAYLHNPVTHSTVIGEAHVETMEHFLFVVYSEDKQDVVARIAGRAGKTMLFGRTQLGVERIANELMREGVACGALHGGKTQAARTKTLQQFKDGITHVLVATDVAARGIHVDGVSLVVHIDPPRDPKDYVHRAGRTARAGAEGAVVTIVAPRQQKSVTSMMSRAGVTPDVVRIKPTSSDLVRITGAREPSGVPWHPPAVRSPQGGRGRGGRPSGGRPSRKPEKPRFRG